MPTQIQSLKAVILCQLLSNSFQPKYLDKNKRYCEVSGGAGSKGSRERDYSLFTFLKTLHFIYVRLLTHILKVQKYLYLSSLDNVSISTPLPLAGQMLLLMADLSLVQTLSYSFVSRQ